MNQKLTLSIEQAAIERGKRYAARRNASLSHLVETFLILLDDSDAVIEDIPVSSKLQSLVGIGAGSYDEHEYRRYLEAKHA